MSDYQNSALTLVNGDKKTGSLFVKKVICLAAAIAAASISQSALAQSNQNAIYGGVGTSIQAKNADTSDKTPFSIGYLRLSNTKNFVWGVDVSQEGTMLDSTWGQNGAVKQGTSINVLLGTKLTGSEKVRLDAAILVGGRQKTTSCPDSYLGFRCYANAQPDVSYALNYGGVVTVSFSKVMIGARVSSESAQGLIGFRF